MVGQREAALGLATAAFLSPPAHAGQLEGVARGRATRRHQPHHPGDHDHRVAGDQRVEGAEHVDVLTVAGDSNLVLRALADHTGSRVDHTSWIAELRAADALVAAVLFNAGLDADTALSFRRVHLVDAIYRGLGDE